MTVLLALLLAFSFVRSLALMFGRRHEADTHAVEIRGVKYSQGEKWTVSMCELASELEPFMSCHVFGLA